MISLLFIIETNMHISTLNIIRYFEAGWITYYFVIRISLSPLRKRKKSIQQLKQQQNFAEKERKEKIKSYGDDINDA